MWLWGKLASRYLSARRKNRVWSHAAAYMIGRSVYGHLFRGPEDMAAEPLSGGPRDETLMVLDKHQMPKLIQLEPDISVQIELSWM